MPWARPARRQVWRSPARTETPPLRETSCLTARTLRAASIDEQHSEFTIYPGQLSMPQNYPAAGHRLPAAR